MLCFKLDTGCFGITTAVCLSSDRSLHRAEINGKSMYLLRSRKILRSMGVAGAVIALVDVEFVTTLGDSFVVILIDALVRGSVVVTVGGCGPEIRVAVNKIEGKNQYLNPN